MDDTLPPRRPRPTTDDTTRSNDDTVSMHGSSERLGAYVIEGKVGEGGMGKVFRCHDPSLKRSVAIKVLHDKFSRDEYYQARFRREAETLASLSHPAIAQIFAIDSGTDGALMIVMEFVEGRSVDDTLRAEGPVPIEQAVEWTIGVAEGLSAAKEKGVIHRDVKPSNLLVRPDGHVKIVDFGLSKDTASKNTITDEGMVLGTPHYISPEQGRGLAVDERSDMYSLGATLYHMVTGAPPFEGKSQIAVIVSHVEDDPRPPHELRPEVPRGLTAVIGRMMAKSPTDRYASYAELVDDLRRIVSGETPTAARKNGGRFGAPLEASAPRRVGVVLTILLLLALGALAGWLIHDSRRSERSFAHASRLGDWYSARSDGGAVLAFDFSKATREARTRFGDAFLFDSRGASSGTVETPGLSERQSALTWTNYGEPLTCVYPFEKLDELQLVVEAVERHTDVCVSLIDPLGSKRRQLRVCWSGAQETPTPLYAELHGDPIPIDGGETPDRAGETSSSVPRMPAIYGFPYKLFVELTPADGSTSLVVKVVALSNESRQKNSELYRFDGELPGESWSRCAVVLHTASSQSPYRLSISELVLSGIPDGNRLEQTPWQD